MEKYTFKGWITDFCNNIWVGFCYAWKLLGVWAKIIGLIVPIIVGWLIDKVLSLAPFWRGFLYTILAYVGIAILYAIFVYPHKVISEQKSTISLLRKEVDRKDVIKSLSNQRRIGVELLGKGKILLHESQIGSWWEEHRKWRDKTKQLIALIDEAKAIQWDTLGTYQPKRPFIEALNSNHRKMLQMFDEWLSRLDRLIDGFSS